MAPTYADKFSVQAPNPAPALNTLKIDAMMSTSQYQ